MKPEWKDAPMWAQFLAQNKSGRWFWFEKPPIRDRPNHMWYVNDGKTMECSRKQNAQWERSLEVRPLEKKQTRNR